MKKKIENATAFIDEIDSHKKSIFEFWKYSKKDEVATLPEGWVEYEQLKTLKLYSDKIYIYMFCEFDPKNALTLVPYFDVDSDPSTGNDSKWNGAGYEAKAEGALFEELDFNVQGEPCPWDPCFYYYGEWTEEVLRPGIAVISSTPVSYRDGTMAFEAAILRDVVLDALKVTDKTKLTMGLILYDINWDYIGKLPCKTIDELEYGVSETMLTLMLP